MNIARYEPYGLIRRIQDELGRAAEESGQWLPNAADASSVVTSHWAPAVDIKEEADRFLITADLPGVDSGDIEVTLENGVLTVKGERRREDGEERDGYKRVERVYGTFHRRFSLPDTADAERVEATSRNGVLSVSIPKHEKVQARRITVN